jgi:hypothetical protein
LRNVTAVAAGANSYGLYLRSSGGSGTTTNVRNSILRGDGKDVALQPTVPASGTPGCNPATDPGCLPYFPPQPAGTLVIGNSNYRSAQVGDGGTLTDAGGNSTADPLFAGAADFHLRSGSPAIDAGADDALNGPLDLDGKVRKLGAAPDMGAYESDPPSLGGGGVADTIAPRLTALGITNKVFTVGSHPTPVGLARAKAKKGTTFVFTSSEAGTATITISRAAQGRRRGRRCVKTTKKNRKARKCTRYTAARPPLTRRAVAGANAVPFSGRIGTKALKPGSYRATIVVADAAGNRSQAKSIGFKVVKK